MQVSSDSPSTILHQLFVWGSDSADRPVTEDEHQAFRSALEGRSWIEVFPGVAVVLTTYQGERIDVMNALRSVAEERDGRLSIVASPPIPVGSGRYGGLLPEGKFDEVRKRTGA